MALNEKNGKKREEMALEFEEELEDRDSRCGLGSFKPDFMQVFARIGAFVGIYSISGLLTSTLSVYVNSQVSMLERQFGFSSAETGLLMGCNDIGFLSCIIFTGYIARKVHIPRGVGLTTILFGVTGIMCALPYFIQDRAVYELDRKVDMLNSTVMRAPRRPGPPMCAASGVREFGCKTNTGEASEYAMGQLWTKKVAFALIAIGMVFQGIGKSPRASFTTLYIDDAVDKRKTGFYIGILTGTGIFGPALAYLLGGFFSKIYVTLEDVDITPRDPRWIGAWWLGFLVFGGCALVFALPLMCFPRHLRKKSPEQILEERKVKANKPQTTFLGEAKDFARSMGRVLGNPVYLLITLSTMINMFSVAGTIAFMPKYLAAQYSVPLWQANMILAASNIAAVSLGSFLGGVISRRFKLTPSRTMKFIAFLYFVNIFFVSSGFYLGCDQPEVMGGAQEGRELSPLYKTLDNNCTAGCGCKDTTYFPICGGDGLSYFSPCHAGCRQQSGLSFTNCTCIEGGRAAGGLCDQGCDWRLYMYAAFTFAGSLAAALKIIPTYLTKIRCVEPRDRSVSVAIASFASSAFGWMPGPVVFGRIIDSTCSLWKYTCGERQSCLLYDAETFRNILHVFMVVARVIALLLVLLNLWLVRNKADWDSNLQANKEVAVKKGHDLNSDYKRIPQDDEEKNGKPVIQK